MKYCDYDALVLYEAGQFNAKFKTDLSGKLLEVEPDETLSETDKKSFVDGKYRTCICLEPLVLYRVYGRYLKHSVEGACGKPSGARLTGRFASTEFAESIIDAKLRLALAPEWKNVKMYEAKLLVPKGTRFSVGIVAKVKLPTGSILPGGAEQLILPNEWSEEWVVGYRRITSRQLEAEPHFWPEKPSEIAAGKDKLYQKICPLCGYWRTKQLDTQDWIEVTGCKRKKVHFKKYMSKSRM